MGVISSWMGDRLGTPRAVGNFFLSRHVGSDGSMSASGSAGTGFNPRRGSKFLFEKFQPRG